MSYLQFRRATLKNWTREAHLGKLTQSRL